MGNVIDSNLIELFLKANGIFNISVSDHLVKNNAQIQNVLHTTIFIHNTNTLHTKIVNIIGQNNYYENYILHKNSIINKIIHNKYMGGVDQLLECYNIIWKSRRWWIKLFYYFCDATIVN